MDREDIVTFFYLFIIQCCFTALDLVALDNTHRLFAANNHAAIQNIVNQQNALR